MVKRPTKKESLAVGGQAVIEGVMMRNDDWIITAVRTPKGTISLRYDHYVSFTKRQKILGLPFVRGIINLFEIMIIGMKSLTHSSNESLGEHEELGTWELVMTIGLSIVVSLAIFKFLPLLFATYLNNQLGGTNVVFNLLDAAIKLAILVGYIGLIGLMPDVKRLFQYHGAEHKSINCYEAKKPLTVKNVLAQSRFHPRCGTTFLLFVILISIFFYLFIPIKMTLLGKLGLRIALLPFIAGVSYELIKWGGRHHEHWFVKLLLTPGMILQRITTNEPDGKQAAVAIKSLKAALHPPKQP